jgi:hypothetical protein
VPRSLFHYQRLVEAHLIALLAKRTVKLSRPDTFNDPWDCRVHYRVPSDQPGRQRLLQWLTDRHRARFSEITEAERVRVAREFMLGRMPTLLNTARAVRGRRRVMDFGKWSAVPPRGRGMNPR